MLNQHFQLKRRHRFEDKDSGVPRSMNENASPTYQPRQRGPESNSLSEPHHQTDNVYLPKSIMVPLDGSSYAERAIGPAMDLAASLGINVGLAQVVIDDRFANEAYLNGLANTHRLGWWQVVINPDAVLGLHNLATERSSMLCMSTHGHGRSAAILGSTAEELSLRSTFPVVLIGRSVELNMRQQFRRFVVPLDGTPESETALSSVLPWARHLGLPVELVTVVEPVPTPLRTDHPLSPRFGPEGNPSAYLEDVLARIPTDGAVVGAHVQYDPISPASGIADLLRNSPDALVVVATHARTGLSRFIHGSVAGTIVDRSPVPVIEFRMPDTEAE